jgi:hypothetical protein
VTPSGERTAAAQEEYVVGIETLSGVACEPQTQAVEQKTMLRFKVDGRRIELEPARAARCCPIREGDDVTVVGRENGDQVTALAYWNRSLGCIARASCGQEMTQGVLCLLTGIAMLVVAWILPNDIAFLKWAGRVGGTAVAALFWLFTEAYFHTIRTTFRAEFSLMRTALETVRGIARDVACAQQRSPRGRLQASKVSMKLDGRPVELHGFPAATIGEGDEVIVVGKQHGGVLMGTAYRNFTRSKAEAITGVTPVIVAALLFAGVAGFLYLGWSSQQASGPDLADWLRWPFCLVLGITIAYETAEPIYAWTLRRKAHRRMRSEPHIKARTEASS